MFCERRVTTLNSFLPTARTRADWWASARASVASIWFPALLIGLVGSLAGCGDQKSAGKQAAAPVPSVIVQTVEAKDLLTENTFTGRVEAKDKVQIRARVQGYLKSRHFDEGAEVSKGELLFEIEPESFQIVVSQAEANLASAKSALTLAQQTFDRTKELASRNTASKASLDTAQSTLSQAQASVLARQAELDAAKLNLSYTRILAPMAGRVGRAAYSVGNLVNTASDPLVTLVAQDPIFVAFPVPQRLLLEVNRSETKKSSVLVKLRLSDGSTYDQVGEISFVDVQATASTDSVTVRALMPNPKRILVDQQLVDVLIVQKQPVKKLVISQSALLLDQQGAYVLAVGDDKKVQIKRITTGEQRGPLIVVDSGLDAGERVIVSGHQKVQPGGSVNPQFAASSTDATKAAKR